LRDRKPCWAIATPGGLSQTVTLTQVLSGMIDRDLTPSEAISEPRWCLGRGRELLIERDYEGIPPSTIEGERINIQHDPYGFGSAKVVAWSHEAGMSAAADGRRDAAASAF